MKSLWKYIVVLLVTIIFTVLHGFIVGEELTLWFGFVIFSVSTIVLVFFDRKPSAEKILGRILKIVVTATIMVGLSVGLYGMLNESSYTFIDEYETEITDVWLHGGRIDFNDVDLFFVTPDGEEKFVTIYSETPPSQGDKITIYEYEGLFWEHFYRYHGIAE